MARVSGPVFLMLGHGYSAAALAASLRGWRVVGTTRSAEKAAAMRARGIEPVDWADAAAVDRAIGAADGILVSLPPSGLGDPVLIRHEAALARADLAWIGYLSTTGVYGDRGGGWVDEESPLDPTTDRGRWRRAAERAWSATGLPVRFFRLAGIYGPGRSALDRLRAGRAQRVVRPGQVFSRIHVDDVARVLAASMARSDAGRTYNVVDDEPAPPEDVIAFAARLLGMPVPPAVPFEAADLTPMQRSFYGESKRVSNRRIRQELGVTLLHPDYRAGLRAILAAGG
jgi:nucleoside-diphosphate-sugar epimerase